MKKRKTESANLENKRKVFLEIGFIITLIAVLIALEWKSYADYSLNPVYKSNNKMDEIISPLQLKKQEVVPKKPRSFMALNIVENDEVDNIIEIDVDTDEDEDIGIWVPEVVEETPIDEVIPYFKVEVKPEFPGGETAMLQFVANNFKVPRVDLEQGVSGTIYVSFTIDKTGAVTNIRIARGIASASDMEALRVVSMMPRWSPGRQVTQNVSVDFNLPIKIKLM